MSETESKKLFCVVVTDLDGGWFSSPVVYHIRTGSFGEAEEITIELLIEEYGYDVDVVESDLEIFAFPVTDAEIIER